MPARRPGRTDLLIGGGVAANRRLRALLAERAAAAGHRGCATPRPALCTDNGAMIAVLGAEVVTAGAPALAAGHRRRLLAAGQPHPALTRSIPRFPSSDGKRGPNRRSAPRFART